jgi:hypothetical protein
VTIKLDDAGLAAILKGAGARALVKKTAQEIASRVEAQDLTVGAFRGGSGEIPLPVKVKTETTDRASASVVLAHPAGIAVQAKHGALTRAAAALGLTVQGD